MTTMQDTCTTAKSTSGYCKTLSGRSSRENQKAQTMYAAIRRGQTDLSNLGEVRRRIEQNFVPIISTVPGFVAYYAVHIGNGVVITVSLYDKQAGAEESSRRSTEWVKQNPAYLLLTP